MHIDLGGLGALAVDKGDFMASTSDTADCPLPASQQTRNLLLFASCTGLQYLAAPIGYVGITQAPLCSELGASDAVANLPATFYLGLTFFPVIFAWLIPYVSWLKRNLVTCYAVTAASQVAVAMVLLASVPNHVKIIMVVLQSALFGIAGPSAIAFLWELVGRGASETRRGLALGLAFGVGPALAVLGSLGSQLIIKGSVGPFTFEPLGISLGPFAIERPDFPGNFAVLYAAAAPAMALAGILACFFIVPLPASESVREPFLESVFGGLLDFLKNPVLRMASIVTVLLYVGNTIISNMNLYSQEVFGDSPTLHAGYQNAARFFFKMMAGLSLGWLLTRTNPKIGLLATGLTFLASVLLAMVATAETYLLVFGIYGAGELVGVYAPNYILSASRPEDMRRNMAFTTMMMAPAAPAGYLFGVISGTGGAWWGKAAGFRASFATCAAIMLVGIVLAVIKLPARPARAGASSNEAT
jgi:MFS family permease